MADHELDSRPLIRKQGAISAHGMITCIHPLAAQAGLDVLRAGGNAIDAAVTAGFVLGVVEPMMSGIGGGGVMVIRKADGATVVIDHSPCAPAAAHPEVFPLAGSGNAGFYAWPRVKDDLNIVGPLSVAVPGTIAGYSTALARFGTRSLAEIIAPAIQLAADGFDLNGFTAAAIALDMVNLRRFPETARIFIPNGVPLLDNTNGAGHRLIQRDLAQTMMLIAKEGPETFYQGEIARRLVGGLGDDALLTTADLENYTPRIYEGDETKVGTYRSYTLHGAPYEGGAVTTAAILGIVERFHLGDFGPGSGMAYHLIAESARRAFADRFSYLEDHKQVNVPWAELRSPEHFDRRAAEIDLQSASANIAAGLQPSLVVGHTTQLTVVDADRTAVSLTQTHLDYFGSRVIPIGTGVIMNNGMMWFDPRPGRPNSVAGGKWSLNAMSPIVLSRGTETFMALGASGGRRILTAVAQVISNVVDHDLGPQVAIDFPRVHCDGAPTLIDSRATPSSQNTLRRMNHQLTLMTETASEVNFALPNAIVLGPHGVLRGGVDTLRPGTARGH